MTKSGSHLQRKILFVMVPLLLIAAILLGAYDYYKTMKIQQTELLENVKNLTAMAALITKGETVEKIQSREEYNTIFFRELQDQLSQIRQHNNLKQGAVRILRRKGMNTEIVVTDQNYNAIGLSFDFWAEMNPAFDGQLSGKYLSRDGRSLVAGIAPVLNADLTPVAILIIEKEVNQTYAGLLDFFVAPAIASVFLILCLFWVVNSQGRKINKRIFWFTENLEHVKNGQKLSLEESDAYLNELAPVLTNLEVELKGYAENRQEREKIQKQITALLRTVNAAAEGDFTQKAAVTADTLGALADSFNLMVSDLSALIRDAKNAADQVSSSTRNILNNIEMMSRGAADQAAKTEDISQSAKEMAELITNTNQNAHRAAEAAQKAKTVAEDGSEILKKSITGMHIINNSVSEAARQVGILRENSTRIGEISDFIRELSSRTNLLALNASIEAARAGEAGRGFSLVVEEIRNLADRANKSAAEISDLISDIQNGISKTVRAIEKGTNEVSQGTELVDKAGETFREILGTVDISTNSVVDISAATQEQTKFSKDIVSALEKIAGIAKETAENAKLSREAASNLEALSKTLNQAVEKFRLAH